MPIRRSPNGRHSHPSTAWSRSSGMGGRDRSEQVVAINRKQWSGSFGISGRNHPERAFLPPVEEIAK
jgi:hypothetical protein